MKLFIKQKVFSFTSKFTVKDETGADKYSVEGELLSLKRLLHVYDASGYEIALVYRRLMNFMPHYVVEARSVQIAEIVKELSFFIPKYHLLNTAMRLEGDFFEHEYVLRDGMRDVVRVSKEWLTWGDSYVLDIDRPEDELLALGVVLAVDCVTAYNSSS